MAEIHVRGTKPRFCADVDHGPTKDVTPARAGRSDNPVDIMGKFLMLWYVLRKFLVRACRFDP
jgi:hypothetical protein